MSVAHRVRIVQPVGGAATAARVATEVVAEVEQLLERQVARSGRLPT